MHLIFEIMLPDSARTPNDLDNLAIFVHSMSIALYLPKATSSEYKASFTSAVGRAALVSQ